MRRAVLALAVLALATPVAWGAAAPAPAATRIVTETRLLDRDPVRTQRAVVVVDGRRLRMDAADERNSVIFDADQDKVWMLDHTKRRFFQVDRGTTRAVSKKLSEANRVLQERLAGLPPEQRAAMERLLGDRLPEPPSAVPAARIETRPTGASDTVRGQSCDVVEVLRDARRVAEMCRVDPAAAGVDREVLAVFEELAVFLRESVQSLAPKGMDTNGIEAIESFSQLEGVPLRVRAFSDGRAVSETTVVEIAPATVPPAHFEVPSGYSGGFSIDQLDSLRGR